MFEELLAIGIVFASVLVFGIWYTVKNEDEFHL